MFTFLNSFMFDFELTRILGSTSSGGCDAGEFKSAVGKIKKHDAESWYRAWKEQGERAKKIGDEAAKAGFKILARNAYLRASNYFRAASYMFSNDDTRVIPFSEKSIRSFQRATALMDGEVLSVEIPYEKGFSLLGYLYLPPQEARLPGKTPVVMYLGGADSTKEELYFLFGHSGPPLGYAILCFEGPGQGLLLKRSKLPLRPDFEVVAGIALDFLEKLSESRPDLTLDLGRIAVAGAATGGYFALRSATDSRIKACVAIDPFFSLWDLALTRAPESFIKLWDRGWVPDGIFDWLTELSCKMDFQAGWEMMLGKSSMGVEKPTAMLRRFKEFSLESKKYGKILDKITCPVFLTGPGAGREMYASADDSTLKIHRLITKVSENNKRVWVPTDVADGGLTAKIGAWALLAQKSFEFLDQHFEIRRKKL
ncbi:alpha/beta-hydrolase [Mollisia scopiformis]|uniref:Alpha/beta-hydrolase n=1 Tax=Mollisia scopiformis TaxID=149040 RepID=A0A194XK10_MOLSC|nr:alpha/beta-hydrolase [Mollisia scopiformis]KUJ20444.1 alpha/beta-hydrolase [Mollisia scopiformis]